MKVKGYEIRPNANLTYANLTCADLTGANLTCANLTDADLTGANLTDANLTYANLADANLTCADLTGANLTCANLTDANLTYANLTYANLTDADLTGANLTCANLSQSKGLLSQKEWILKNFKTEREGIVVYKNVDYSYFSKPTGWKIEEGSFLQEVCNFVRTDDCGCGVNFATEHWIMNEWVKYSIWKCLIHWEDLLGVCVPYNTDGKARCERLQLICKL